MKKQEGGLSAGRLTMMALGTVIGGSFFLGSAIAVRSAGPAVLLSFVFGGVLVYFILSALSEMTVANPDSGSFRTFAAEAFGQGAGFVVGWVYWTGMVFAMSSEATAASILLREWIPSLNVPLLGSTLIIGVTLLNLMGADRLSTLESSLASVKIFAIAAFIVAGSLLIFGAVPGKAAVGLRTLRTEPFAPGGAAGVAGSMLMVMSGYAGFEIIGLAASEAGRPRDTIPRAIRQTVLSLVGFYIFSTAVLLALIPTQEIDENAGPMAAALDRYGIGWAGTVINLVLITAILSTMLASMFGLGRMLRSLAQSGFAPGWLRESGDVPRRGILFSGASMLLGLGVGLLFPKAYLFLISSGGFAALFTYAVMMATHIRFRRKNGCPPDGKCQLWGYPYTSLFTLLAVAAILLSMPFVPGQETGLAAGAVMVAAYSAAYAGVRVGRTLNRKKLLRGGGGRKWREARSKFSSELSEEKTPEGTDRHRDK